MFRVQCIFRPMVYFEPAPIRGYSMDSPVAGSTYGC